MRLFLVRHGQTPANADYHLDTGFPGAPLTEHGWSQAMTLPARFKAVPIDAIVTSHLDRTRQTALPLAQAWGGVPAADERIREILAGRLEMLGDEDSVAAYHRRVDAWSHGQLELRMPGAESGQEVIDRYDAAIADVRQVVGADGTAVFFSHGAVIRTWSRYRAVNADFAVHGVVANTGVVELTDDAGVWRIVSWMGR